MPILRTTLLAAALAGATAVAVAEEVQIPVPGPADEGAFSMMPADGRHLKIDRRSGEVSICSEAAGAWSCRLVPDDRRAYEDEIERLQAENDRLLDRIAALEAERDALAGGDSWIGPEDEKKVEEFLDFSDKALRRFFGMVQDLKRDLEQPDSL